MIAYSICQGEKYKDHKIDMSTDVMFARTMSRVKMVNVKTSVMMTQPVRVSGKKKVYTWLV